MSRPYHQPGANIGLNSRLMGLLDILDDLSWNNDSDDEFVELMQYFREPFDPSDENSFEQRAATLKRLEKGLLDRMEVLAARRGQLASNHGGEDEAGFGFGDGDGAEEDAGDGIEEDAEDVDGPLESEGPPVGERRKRPSKLRQPYTITCAIRSTNWFESSLQWENQDFREIYRVSKETFWGIVNILQRNPIFQSRGNKPQRPVHHQLAVFLLRYGIAGSHERHPRLLTSIGAGTVSLYWRRVIRAVREYGLTYIAWPKGERREEVKHSFKKLCGLDGIIGALDGTLCGLETKPRIEGNSYISRKKTPSVNVQAMVDHNGQFIAFQSGWPGSRPDCAVWQHMWVFNERWHLFKDGEFLLADGGYPLSPVVLTPFARNELAVDGQRWREFNCKISRARIVVEWAFGRLKARFPALKRLGAVRDVEDIYRAIEALMIVHNLCYDLGDVPESSCAQPDVDHSINNDENDSDDQGLDDDEAYGEGEEQRGQTKRDLLQAGRVFCERCVDVICPR